MCYIGGAKVFGVFILWRKGVLPFFFLFSRSWWNTMWEVKHVSGPDRVVSEDGVRILYTA